MIEKLLKSLFLLILGTVFLSASCEKEDDAAEDPKNEASCLSATDAKLQHLTGSGTKKWRLTEWGTYIDSPNETPFITSNIVGGIPTETFSADGTWARLAPASTIFNYGTDADKWVQFDNYCDQDPESCLRSLTTEFCITEVDGKMYLAGLSEEVWEKFHIATLTETLLILEYDAGHIDRYTYTAE